MLNETVLQTVFGDLSHDFELRYSASVICANICLVYDFLIETGQYLPYTINRF